MRYPLWKAMPSMRPASAAGCFLLVCCVVLASACVTGTRPSPTDGGKPVAGPAYDPQLVKNCAAMQAGYDWKLAAAPPATQRGFFSLPKEAPFALWFRGRKEAVAACTPCSAKSTAVHSFEWYEPDFKKGELALKTCARK
jgi:hypothetical protein